MYRYDAFDQRLVDERVAQFRDQTRRFLAGELSRGRIPSAAPAERPLYPAARADAADLDPVRAAVVAPAAQARADRARLRPRLRPLQHAPEPAAQLAAARGRSRHPRRARDGARCTRSRRRATTSAISPAITSPAWRPTRSSTPRPYCELIRQWATLASGVRVPAAQVQDRRHRRDQRPAGGAPARHRARGGRERTRRARLPGHRRRRHGPHADHRPCDPRVSAPRGHSRLPRGDPAHRTTASAAATTSGRRASRSSSRSARPRSSRSMSRRSSRTCKDGPSTLIAEEFDASRAAASRAPPYEAFTATTPASSARSPTTARSANWAKRNVHPHKVAGYAAVTLSLKQTGVPPGDATSDQMDAVADLADRYAFGELRRHARAEPRLARRAPGRPARAVERVCGPSVSRRPTSAC